jgi:hypothetical protein
MVFKYNLRWTYNHKWIVYFNDKVDFKAEHMNFEYDLETDDLIIKNGYDSRSGKSTHVRVKNASKIENDFSVNGKGKQLNSI